ncbi:MAG: vWA domain-containing protein [Anaerolineae bacterium]
MDQTPHTAQIAPLGRPLLPTLAAITALSAAAIAAGVAPAATGGAPVEAQAGSPLADLVFVADDNAVENDGCDAVSVFSLRSAEPVFRGHTHISPGRLAASGDFTTILANNTSFMPERFLYLTRGRPDDPDSWTTEGQVFGAAFTSVGGIAITTDGDTLLVATNVQPGTAPADEGVRGAPDDAPSQTGRFAVSKYNLAGLARDGGDRRRWSIGPEIARFRLDDLPAEILVADGGLAHVVTVAQEVVTLDIASMAEAAPRIQMAALTSRSISDPDRLAGAVHASLSTDGRYLVANRWEASGPKINVADLLDRTTWTLAVAPDLGRVGGVALNRAESNPGLLAVHAGSVVAIYDFSAHGPLTELARSGVTASPYGLIGINGPVHSIAWSATGSHVIAEDVTDDRGLRVFAIGDGGSRMTRGLGWKMCTAEGKPDWPNDILTANGALPDVSTPTPTRPETSTPTLTPSATPTPTATATSTATPTATDTPPPSATPTTTLTPRPPEDLYIPLALRERCPPFTIYVDVALVVDASTSMLEKTSQGRTKLEAAQEALTTFVGGMRMVPGGDRAALIAFNDRTHRLQALTWDRPDLEAAIERIEVAPGSRVDMGIHRAIFELVETPTQRDRYLAMVVLSDGRAHLVESEAVIAAAEDARDLDIVMFVVGIGPNMDEDTLRAMAGRPDRYYPAPDPESLTAIYGALSGRVICPPEVYWPGR